MTVVSGLLVADSGGDEVGGLGRVGQQLGRMERFESRGEEGGHGGGIVEAAVVEQLGHERGHAQPPGGVAGLRP